MTDEPQSTEPTEEDVEETTPEEDETPIARRGSARLDEYREQRKRAPLVSIQVKIPTDEESWQDAAKEDDGLVARADDNGPIWNRHYRARGGVRMVQARQLSVPFTYESPDFREFDARPGDWLIRDPESGYVFAVTDWAMQHLFESAPQPGASLPNEPMAEPGKTPDTGA